MGKLVKRGPIYLSKFHGWRLRKCLRIELVARQPTAEVGIRELP